MIQFNLDTAEAVSASTAFSVSVIGIGGSGTNVIDKMALEGMSGADLVSMNCDARALKTSMAGTKLQLGKALTQGLGCGGDPELGGEAAMASEAEIRHLLQGRSMVFLCVGLGGGTGSGAAPVIARMAREAGAFVVVFATLPFAFEGRRRSNQATMALQDLRKYSNALVTFENDRMGELVVPKKGVQEAFELADKIIGQSVRAVTSLVTQPGLIHIGMDDLVTALRNTDSRCLFGYGQAKGESRAVEALAQALKSPLIDRGQMLSGARNVLVHICGGTSLTLFEIEILMRELGKHVHEDAQILFGAATDAKLQENLSVTILTSLTKPSPVTKLVEAPATVAAVAAVEVVPIRAMPEVVPPSTLPAVVEAVVAPINNKVSPAEAPPAPVPPVAKVSELPVPPMALEEELFPETDPPVARAPEPVLIEIPAATVRAIPAPALVALESYTVEEFVEETEEIYEDETLEEIIGDMEPELESIHGAAAPLAESEPIFEEPIEEIAAEIPAPPPVPERVIRIERRPAAPVRPVASSNAKRFVLSDIIKRDPKTTPAPLPVMEYESVMEEEEEVRPVAPARPAPAPAPVSRRAPDFDHVSPIRPIPAGRSATPAASPFTAAKPTSAVPARPTPTQQQTFDERLQPANAGGRFERVKPTVEEGEDLDVPTFLRRKR